MNKKLVLFGIAAAALVGIAAFALLRETPQKLLKKGIRCSNAKNYSEAVKWYRKAADQGKLLPSLISRFVIIRAKVWRKIRPKL